MPDINDLRFVRIIDPNVFGVLVSTSRHLFQDIEDMSDEKIDALCNYSSSILTSSVFDKSGRIYRVPNPLVHIAVLVDKENKFKGFLWAGIDVIEKHVLIRAFSIDKEYRSNAKTTSDVLINYLKNLDIAEEFKRKIIAATLKPKAYERCGWTKSKRVLMEFEVNRDGNNKV